MFGWHEEMKQKMHYFGNKCDFNTGVGLDQFDQHLCSYVSQDIVNVRTDKGIAHDGFLID